MGYIYMITSPSGKKYIGQTIRSIKERLDEHPRKKDCIAIHNAIQKYGWENMKKEWYRVPDEDLNFYEEMMVTLLGTLSPDGYNLKEGGGNCGKHSETTIQKMKESQSGEKNPMFGKTRTDETKKKHSESTKGEKNHMYGNGHLIAGEKNPMFGKTLTKDHRQKISKSRIGKYRGEKNGRSKKVYQYDLDNNLVQSFESCGEAARHLGNTSVSSSNIRACARNTCGKHKSAYGFKWTFVKM